MSIQTYHFLHLIGLILVFIGFGGLLSSEGAKKAMKWHGIGLVISLVSGFGMLAKMSKGARGSSLALHAALGDCETCPLAGAWLPASARQTPCAFRAGRGADRHPHRRRAGLLGYFKPTF
jgi:hypothetical protein